MPPKSNKTVPVSAARIAKNARRAELRKIKRKFLRTASNSVPNTQQLKLGAALSSMSIPRNEQDMLSRAVAMEESEVGKNFMLAQICPKEFLSRVPDSFARPTMNPRSVQVIEVPVVINGTPDSGRFAMSVSPHLGSIAAPEQYKVAMVDATTPTGWPGNDALDPAIYVTSVQSNDIRLDPFVQQLTQPEMGSSVIYNDGGHVGVTTTAPFGASPQYDAGYNLDVGYAISGGFGNFYPPPGQYTFVFMFSTIDPTGDMTPNLQQFNGAQLTQEFFQISVDTTCCAIGGYLYIPQLSASNGYLQPGFRCGVAVTGITTDLNSSLFITSTFTDTTGIGVSYNNGDMTGYRPVAMSVLATYVGPELTNGGIICTSLLASGAAKSGYFQSNNNLGNFRNWENLSKTPGSYNGPLKDGTYCWWTFQSQDDYRILSPDDILTKVVPTIMVSGQWQPGPGAATGAILRLEIVTIYEGVTESLLYEQKYLPGSQAIMDRVFRLLSSEPHAMANAAHIDWINSIKKALGKVIGFGVKNKDTLLPLASQFASMFI